MHFKRTLKAESGQHHLDSVPLINIALLLFAFFILTSGFNLIQGTNMRMPDLISPDTLPDPALVITLSDVDHFFVDGREVTLARISELLNEEQYRAILIKAGSRVNLGTLTQLWSICKKSGIETIGIATVSP